MSRRRTQCGVAPPHDASVIQPAGGKYVGIHDAFKPTSYQFPRQTIQRYLVTIQRSVFSIRKHDAAITCFFFVRLPGAVVGGAAVDVHAAVTTPVALSWMP